MGPKNFAVNWFLMTQNHCIPLYSAAQHVWTLPMFAISLQPKVFVRSAPPKHGQFGKTNSIPDYEIVTVVLHASLARRYEPVLPQEPIPEN